MTQPAPRVFRAPREWTRMHPVSPLLGGAPVFAVAGTVMVANLAPGLVGWSDDQLEFARSLMRSVVLFVVGVIVFVVIMVLASWLLWRVNEYKIDDDSVHQRKGLIFKQQRQARLDRLQAVDVVQPLVARIFGFAKLNIEVAGGSGSAVVLEFLRLGDAEAIRNEILALSAGIKRAKAAGIDATVDDVIAAAQSGDDLLADGSLGADAVAGSDLLGTPQEVGQASLRDLASMPRGVAETAELPERPIYAIKTGMLFESLARSSATVFLALTPVVAAVAALVFHVDVISVATSVVGASLASILPMVLAVGGYYWSRLATGYGFKAALAEDGLRLRHGLLETRRQTVPPGRVQAVRFHQPWLWRSKDWWRVTINVAGYQDDEVEVSTLLPVGTRHEALMAMWLVLPDLGVPDPAGTVSTALSGVGDEGEFLASPRRARLFDPWQWRHRGVKSTDRALLIRRGRWSRELFVVPHERMQSLAVHQGPLQRRRGLANFEVHSTQGPVKPRAHHMDLDDALELLEAQSARAAHLRKRQTQEEWIEAVGLRD